MVSHFEEDRMWDLDTFGSNIAVINDAGTSLTYSQLMKASQQFYSNISERCLIFILCNNSIGSIVGYVSSLMNHIVPLLLNADLDKSAIQSLIDKYVPRYLWVPKELINWNGYTQVYADSDYCLLKNLYPVDYSLNPDLALLLTTSGSTGSPKFVRQSYTNIKSNTKSIIEYLRIVPTDRAITTLPMNYTYGLSIINTHLYAGATILVTGKTIMQKEFWTFLKEQKATTFGGVPYTYEMLHKLRFERMDLPSLRYLTQAGGKLSTELQKTFIALSEKSGIKFIIMYGQCEATARMSYLPSEESATHLGSIGIPIPGGRFKLFAEDGSEINECNKSGELAYLGQNVTLGYSYSKDDLNKGDERKGILLTGDIALFDENGYYYIVGRKKRFLKVFGNRVNLDELEQILKDRYVGIECAVAGIDDHIKIFVTNPIDIDEVRKYLSHKTGLNSIAFTINRVTQIPKNDSGKTMYEQLNRLA